ncbi:MAG: hypothetical protein A2V72_02320 [Candidatus Nealsonbacteria bacterium RBG_13_37_56]|uniref:Type II secretion system protein n=1 Tax=Candidatus Nealsonbacteria bacterium RBG_13_37_56 TaxID=1801661 RepID=A0A1G2DX30_9BACT|nr:MAG: hypothetical protein A2V72_02320 [Candidatus Nealsonbacteria bacterium RBG_13_37_56]
MKKNRGFGLVEIIISVGLVATFILTFSTLIMQAMKTSRTNNSELKAMIYLQELIEIGEDLEQSNWQALNDSNCQSPNLCHAEIQENKWILLPEKEIIDNYSRSLSVENVYRNQVSFPNEITETEGVLDPNTKKVIAKISWNNGFEPRELILETYLYDYQP